MLEYRMQVRDLVHGYIGFTALEQRVIDHPLFQRLRNVRQADVAYYVYPSSNISRFEHLLGACHVAGAMAEQLTRSPQWEDYLRDLMPATGISTPDQFVQTARLYALVHDIGHLPLSHLFERSLAAYVETRGIPIETLIEQWFGVSGFDKPHEAYGARIIRQIADDIPIEEPIRSALTHLMTEKELRRGDMLNPLKLLIDSSIDADRIDFVRRDGVLAGGEYGTYDIDRITSSVFLYWDADNGLWQLVYSERALSSLEALLFDRYLTYTWINFHQRVVAMKLLVRYLIRTLLEQELINASHFQGDSESMALRNDIWLWGLIHDLDPGDNATVAMAKRAVLQRSKENVLNLWKNRPIYEYWFDQLTRQSGFRELDFKTDLPEEDFGHYLSARLGVTALVFYTNFNPVGRTAIRLYDEHGKWMTGRHLAGVSELVSSLPTIWSREPQIYVLLLGDLSTKAEKQWQRDWLRWTARYLPGDR